MVVRADILVFALLVAEHFQREIGDHLVSVHVGRGAGAPLNEVGHELLAHLAGDQLVAGGGDRIGDRRVQRAKVAVGQCGRLFHIAERPDEAGLQRHRDAGDVEVVPPAQRLHAVIGLCGDLPLAKEVLLDPCSGRGHRRHGSWFGHGFSPRFQQAHYV